MAKAADTVVCVTCGTTVAVATDCPTCGRYARRATPVSPAAAARQDAKAKLAEATAAKLAARRKPKAAKPRPEPTVKITGAVVYVDKPVADPAHLPGEAPDVDVYTSPGETREAWLLRAVTAMRPWFPPETPVPDVRVSMGFPAGRGSSKLIGQCWYTTDDKAPALFVSPELSATTDIVQTTLHEMIHAAVGSKAGHRGAFRKVAMGLGFTAPMRSTPASDPLKARLAEVAWSLGQFPHSKVNKMTIGHRPDVQSTRMLKVACVECGCLIRMTRKWLDEVGAPSCRCGGEMMEGIA